MQLTIAVPNQPREAEARVLWETLRARAIPLPFEYANLVVESRFFDGCDLPPEADANATILPVTRSFGAAARICLSERFFTHQPDVQLGVLLHEAVHVRLAAGPLQRNLQASRDVAARESERPLSGSDTDAKFAYLRQRIAHALLNLVTEIGVDKFMMSQYAWLSADYWETRCRNFFRNARVIADEDTTPSMRSYVAFYRLVALELGLLLMKDGPCRAELLIRRDGYVSALARECDEDTAQWFEAMRIKLLAFDPAVNDAVPDAYNEVCERILAVTA